MWAGHSLIVGRSGCGKTTLAKHFAKVFQGEGRPVLVLTTFPEDNWPCDFITDDAMMFLEMVFSHKNCLVIVDEGSEFVGQYDKIMHKLATRGRHNGHICMFLAQQYKMIAKNIRINCQNLFLFKISEKNAALIEEEFATNGLEKAALLPRFHCLAVIDDGEPFVLPVSAGG